MRVTFTTVINSPSGLVFSHTSSYFVKEPLSTYFVLFQQHSSQVISPPSAKLKSFLFPSPDYIHSNLFRSLQSYPNQSIFLFRTTSKNST